MASSFAAVACGDSGEGAGDSGTATQAPAAASTPTPAATVSAPAQTPSPTTPVGTREPTTTTTATATNATPAPPPSSTPSATEVVATAEPAPAERTPKPERPEDAGRGPETGRPESRSGKPEEPSASATPTTRESKNSESSGSSRSSGSSGGQEYTWHDGDRVERVYLESALVEQPSRDNRAGDVVTRDDGETSIVQRQAWHATTETEPVFRSQSGQLMTLPGGVLLSLDDSWDEARVDRFFADNGISRSNVEDRDWSVNAFLIRTKPGLPSLNLANSLAGLEGVEIASPNWQTEVSLR